MALVNRGDDRGLRPSADVLIRPWLDHRATVMTLNERVAERGDDLAVADEFGPWRWAELDTRLNRLMDSLQGLGIAFVYAAARARSERE